MPPPTIGLIDRSLTIANRPSPGRRSCQYPARFGRGVCCRVGASSSQRICWWKRLSRTDTHSLAPPLPTITQDKNSEEEHKRRPVRVTPGAVHGSTGQGTSSGSDYRNRSVTYLLDHFTTRSKIVKATILPFSEEFHRNLHFV